MDVCGKEYEVLRLLGHGKGGYSYLVTDGTDEYVLKQIHHEPCDYYTFGDKLQSELRDYQRLTAAGVPMPEMLAVDEKQERIIKAYIRGDTICALVGRGQMQNAYLDQIQRLAESLKAQKLNIDYFPTNFVVQDGQLYYVDYECNDYMEQWDFENWGIKYWSQTPEFLEYWNKEQNK